MTLLYRFHRALQENMGLDDTKVTVAGVAELQKALPNCHIEAKQRRDLRIRDQENKFSPPELELIVELPGEITPDSPAPAPNPPEK